MQLARAGDAIAIATELRNRTDPSQWVLVPAGAQADYIALPAYHLSAYT